MIHQREDGSLQFIWEEIRSYPLAMMSENFREEYLHCHDRHYQLSNELWLLRHAHPKELVEIRQELLRQRTELEPTLIQMEIIMDELWETHLAARYPDTYKPHMIYTNY